MPDDKSEKEATGEQKDEAPKTVERNGETLEVWGDTPDKMRKGIELHVTLHVEGDDAPAHDFNKSTVEAVREIIAAGSAKHPELTVTVKKIAEK